MKTTHIGIFLCAGASVTLALPSMAQESEDRASTSLEEIVVTTERRDQRLQDVPLSITAFGSETRDKIGILSIQDMANFTPGLSYNTSTDRPSIRGIARQSNLFSLDSPVANYVDGVYTSTVQDAQRRPIFIERTEILRGPQGALSGRGSIAGAINTISKRPEDMFGVEVRSFVGNYSQYGVEGTITGPLTDWLRARLNLASYNQDDGYFDNVANGDTEGDQPNNRDSVDLMFEADLGENFELFFKSAWVDYEETRRSGVSRAPYVAGVQGSPSAYGPSSSNTVPLASWGYFEPTGVQLGSASENPVITTGDLRNFSSDHRATQELVDDYQNYTSHLTWRGPAFDVKWIGGYQEYTYSQWTDADGTDVIQMTLPTGRVVFPGGVNQYLEDRKWTSNEITMTSTSSGPVQWIAGIFQSKETTYQAPFTLTYAGYDELATPTMSIDALLALFAQPHNPDGIRVVVPANEGNRSVFGEFDGDTTTQAVFGQVDYQYSDEWKFTLGLRYTEDDKEVTEASRIVGNSFGDGLGNFLAGGALGAPMAVDATPVYDASEPLPEGVVADYGIDPVSGKRVRDLEGSWSATTGSIGVDFTPVDDTLIFFRAAVGYRPGGFNAGFINSIPQVDEETVYSYELGYKATLLDQLQLNSSVFYYDFRDNQQPLPTLGRCTDPNDLSSCATLNSFVNLPKSKSLGLEVELNWAVTDNLGVLFNYGYLDASVKDGLASGTNGFSNPDDPAAILPNARPYAQIPGQVDSGYTFFPRYTQDISGNQLANSPKHKFALNLNYTMDFSPGSLILSGSYIWRDEQYSDLFENKLAEVPSYDTIGLRAIWTDAADRYSVIVYGSNLTDEDAADGAGVARQRTGMATAVSPSAQGAAYYRTYNLTPPRTYGLELQYRFGAG
ncbi:MAG: TonB-dependent receptor [Cellvibrionaceae bacterium]